MKRALNKDLSFLEILPDVVSEDFSETHLYIQEHLHLISDNDKQIIVNNLLKELYLMLEYVEKSYNYSSNFRDRDLARYNSTLKNVTILVLMIFLGEGRSLKNEFASFKKDYNKYASKYIGVIAKILDSSDKMGLDNAVINRKIAANEIINKYQVLSIADIDLRSTWENDKVIKINTFAMIEQIEETFELAAV